MYLLYDAVTKTLKWFYNSMFRCLYHFCSIGQQAAKWLRQTEKPSFRGV